VLDKHVHFKAQINLLYVLKMKAHIIVQSEVATINYQEKIKIFLHKISTLKSRSLYLRYDLTIYNRISQPFSHCRPTSLSAKVFYQLDSLH